MSDLTAIRDLAVLGFAGYVAYRLFKKDGIISKTAGTIKKAGYVAGEKLGKLQSDIQKELYLFEEELKHPYYLLDPHTTKSKISSPFRPFVKMGYVSGKTTAGTIKKMGYVSGKTTAEAGYVAGEKLGKLFRIIKEKWL